MRWSVLLLLLIVTSGCYYYHRSQAVELKGQTMGTSYSVKAWSEHEPIDLDLLRERVEGVLEEINDQMSTYRETSELERFNRAGAEEWVPVSPETAAVVEEAQRLCERTGGALDVTVGPLVTLWGFGPGADPSQIEPPSEEDVASVEQYVGIRHVEVRSDPPALKKDVDGVRVDLSAIAKGYAVDVVADVVMQSGADGAMVEIGGEVVARGTRQDGTRWRIGVESPLADQRTVAKVLPLSDLAMATSGDYRNFRGRDGERWCHIIDPRTGRPLPFRGFSVTVLAPSCQEADGLATALVVLGPEEGYNLCVEHDVAAMFSTMADGEPTHRPTPLFTDLTSPAE